MTRIAPLPPPLAARVERLTNSLDGHRERLGGLDPDDTDLASAMEDLLALVRTYDDDEALAALARTGAIDAYRSLFGPRVLRFTWAVERAAYNTLRERDVERGQPIESLLGPNTWGAYARMAETLELVDTSQWQRFLMVGCGPLPDSLFCLHDRTEVPRLVGADRDVDALRMARELAQHLALDRIELRNADAVDLDYGRFDAVCCSIFAAPRQAIMERIAATASPDCVVLLRDPVGMGALLFEPVVDRLPARFEVRAAATTPPGKFMLRYFVLGLRN